VVMDEGEVTFDDELCPRCGGMLKKNKDGYGYDKDGKFILIADEYHFDCDNCGIINICGVQFGRPEYDGFTNHGCGRPVGHSGRHQCSCGVRGNRQPWEDEHHERVRGSYGKKQKKSEDK